MNQGGPPIFNAPSVLVAGVGNVFLGDDGFGCEVAARLSTCALPDGVRVADFGTRAFDLGCALLEEPHAVILVDAVRRGGAPGTLYVIEPSARAAEAAPCDAHGLSPDRALDLAFAEGARPAFVRVLGCEPATFGPEGLGQLGLSEDVVAAVDAAVAIALSLAVEALQLDPVSRGRGEVATGSARSSPSPTR